MKQGRMVNYHGRSRKKTAKIVPQTRAVGPSGRSRCNRRRESRRGARKASHRHRVRATVCQAVKAEIVKRHRGGAALRRSPQVLPLNKNTISRIAVIGINSQGEPLGRYFNSTDLSGSPVATRVDTELNFASFDSTNVPVSNPSSFSAIWTGTVQPAISGDQVFKVASGGFVRLYVNNQLIIDNFSELPKL